MDIHLVVTRHFGDYKPGDRITDEAEIKRTRAGANHANVVAVNAENTTDAAKASASNL